jgi:hypothetical protein
MARSDYNGQEMKLILFKSEDRFPPWETGYSGKGNE